MRTPNYTKISELKKKITMLIRDTPPGKLPQELTFQEEASENIYTVTVDCLEVDKYTDTKGRQWIRGSV